MELREFIRESLVEIAQGVNDAQIEASHLAAIVPSKIGDDHTLEKTYIEFDIAVTASSDKKSGSENSLTGGRLKVVAVEAAASGILKKENQENESTSKISRIKFKVPVNFSAWFKDDDHFLPEQRRKREAHQRRADMFTDLKMPK